MPLSPEEKLFALQRRGLSPDEYDWDDSTMSPVKRNEAIPSSAVNPLGKDLPALSVKPQFTATQTAKRNFLQGLVPSLAGLGSGALASEAIGAPLAPFTFGISAVAAPIIGGIAGAYGAHKAQQKLLEQTAAGKEILANTAIANEQHPVAATVGGLASQLPFMRPSPTMLRDIGKSFVSGAGVGNTAVQVLRNPATANVALGAGIGAGSGLYEEVVDPNDFNIPRFGLNVLGGAALHQPTKLATKIPGIHQYTSPLEMRSYEGAATIPDAASIQSRKPSFIADPEGRVFKEGQEKEVVESILKEKFPMPLRNFRAEDFVKAKVEDTKLKEEPATATLRQSEERPKPTVVTERGEEIYPDYTGNQEIDALTNAKESAADLEARRIEAELSGEERPKFQTKEQETTTNIDELNKAREEAKTLSYEEAKLLKQQNELRKAKLAAAKVQLSRDIDAIQKGEVESVGQLEHEVTQRDDSLNKLNETRTTQHSIEQTTLPKITSLQGVDLKGYALGRKTFVTERDPSTATHEASHILVNDLPDNLKTRLFNAIKKDKKAQEWIASETERGNTWSDGRVSPEEEYLAQRAGDLDIERIRANDASLTRDLKAWFKVNVSKTASGEDIARWLGNRFSYGKTPKSGGKVNANRGAVVQQQEEGQSGTVKMPRGVPPYVGHADGTKVADNQKLVTHNFNPKVHTESIPKINDALVKMYDNDTMGKVDDIVDDLGGQIGRSPYTSAGETIPEVARQQTSEQQPTSSDNENLKPLKVKYKGYQEGFGSKPGLHFYNTLEATEDFPKGDTITRDTALKKGYKIVDSNGERLQPTKQQSTTNFQKDKFLETFTEEELRKPNPFNLTPGKDDSLPVVNLKSRMEKVVGKDELAALNESGLEKWLSEQGGRINIGKLQEWIRENGPKVEVKKLEANDLSVSNTEQALRQFTHEMETKGYKFGQDNFDITTPSGRRLVPDDFDRMDKLNLPKEEFDTIEKYLDLNTDSQKAFNKTSNDSATARYTMVNPKPLNEMEGAVDILVRKPGLPTSKIKNWDKLADYQRSTAYEQEAYKFKGNHFGQSDKNILGWVRGYVDKDPTTGEKVFHVFEVQSDWAQDVRNRKEYAKESPSHRQDINNDDPLLSYYESLALKAAIKHARDLGINKIAISDAETAMLTEGHDRVAASNLEPVLDPNNQFISRKEAEQFAAKMNAQSTNVEWWVRPDPNRAGIYQVLSEYIKPEISQEKGMRQHYDTNIPNILRKITGDKTGGRVVEFGEHQNAFDFKKDDYQYDGPRKDLIFKNLDGTPKTSITARVFDISNIKTDYPGKLFKSGSYQTESQASTTAAQVDTKRKSFLPLLTASFDKVAPLNSRVSKALKGWESETDTLTGNAYHVAQQLEKNYDRGLVNTVKDLHREAYRSRSDSLSRTLSPEEKQVSELLTSYYSPIADEKIKAGILVNGREPGKNRYYVPDQLSDNAIDTLLNKSQTPQGKAMKNEWRKYLVEASNGKVSEKEAANYVEEYVNALGGDRKNYQSVNFGAVRKAAGYGLPKALREQDAIRSLLRYAHRAAADISMFKNLESVPEVASALRLNDPKTGERLPTSDSDISSHPDTREAMQWVTKNFMGVNEHPKFNATVRLIMNGIMGTATGIRDTASIPVNMLPDIHSLGAANTALKAIANVRKESTNALLTGARKPSIDKYQFNDILESPDTYTALVGKAATLLRKYQGREAIENFNRDLTFAVGKELAKHYKLAAASGNEKASAFLKKYDLLTDGKSGEAYYNQVAKNFVDRNQGTYGGRGLPAMTMEGPLAPFLSIQKWSIEKSNTIYQDVIQPFIDGSNRIPLLTYTLGSILTGAAIQELNKLLTGRKPQDPTWEEALSESNAKNITSELATLMQLGSFGGIVGDGLKAITDLGLRGKTPRNIISFPAATSAAELQDNVANFVEAINQGENPWETLKSFALDTMTHNVQGLRMVANRTFNKEDVERSDKYRDLRVFNELTGSPVGDATKANKYLGVDERKFKRTSDIQEAATLLPKLIEKFQDKVAKNPAEAIRFLRGLKSNSYQTMPNVNDWPSEFVRYYEYLRDTQGEQEAAERMNDYITQNAINKVKSSMVP